MHPSSAIPTPPALVPDDPTLDEWWRTVARLDAVRARAFATADPQLLQRVYLPGSPALAADTKMVGVLDHEGLRARGFRLTVRSVSVISVSAFRARLRVVDVPSGFALVHLSGKAVARHRSRPPQSYVLQLIRVPAGWRVLKVQLR